MKYKYTGCAQCEQLRVLLLATRRQLRHVSRARGRMRQAKQEAMAEVDRWRRVVKDGFGEEPQATISRYMAKNRELVDRLDALRVVQAEVVAQRDAYKEELDRKG